MRMLTFIPKLPCRQAEDIRTQCPEAEKITFQDVGPLNLWGPVWPNSLNTP